MSATYRIKVGREHIDRGIPCDSESCAVALAVADAVPGATGVLVCDYELELVTGGKRLVAEVPDVAVAFIRKFDTARSPRGLAPFEFEAVFDPA